MVDGNIGAAAIDRNNLCAEGRTYLSATGIASISGNLYKIDFYIGQKVSTPSGNKIKVFRDDGTNYVLVGEEKISGASISLGSNSGYELISPIALEEGDLIAYYVATPDDAKPDIDLNAGGGTVYYKSGDITGTSAKSGWTIAHATQSALSVYGYIQPTSTFIPKIIIF